MVRQRYCYHIEFIVDDGAAHSNTSTVTTTPLSFSNR